MIESGALRTLLRRDPILFVDAGARGNLEGGWLDIPDECLSVLAFEPDPDARVDWDETTPQRHLERCALWSSEGIADIHVAKVASTSSIWPPNMDYLARFACKHVDPRETQRIISVAARPLDEVVERRAVRPDFLKIDTQGAELQILEGAGRVLDEMAFGALVETWTVPVHMGQGLSHEVLGLMHAHGFSLFQVEVAAAWDRKIVESENVSVRRQVVGLDLLFFRDPLSMVGRFGSATYAAKSAVVAQMYGHYDLAIEVLDLGIEANEGEDGELLRSVRSDMVSACAPRHESNRSPQRPSLRGRWLRILRSALSRGETGPAESKLHY